MSEDEPSEKKRSKRIAAILEEDPAHYKRLNTVDIRRRGRPLSAATLAKRDSKPSVQWSNSEYHKVLNAIKTHGTRDVQLIHRKSVSATKPIDTLKNFIAKSKKMQFYEEEIHGAREDNADNFSRTFVKSPPDDNNIDSWIRKMQLIQDKKLRNQENGSSLDVQPGIPLALDWISKYEKHPPTETCGGVDYALIYSNLSCYCMGEVPAKMNKPTEQRFLQLFYSLKQKAEEHAPALVDKVEYVENGGHNISSTSGLSAWEKEVNNFGQLRGANPLNFPTSFFTKINLPKSSKDDY